MSDEDTTVVRERESVAVPRRGYVEDRSVRIVRPSPADYLARVVKALFGIVQALLILRVVLLLLIANRDNGLVQGILSLTDPLVQPFAGMFRVDQIRSEGGSVVDVAAVVALVAWTIVEWIVLLVLGIFRHDSPVEA